MGQPWDPTKTPGIGTGEGEVPLAPLPPVPKLDTRTMASDQKSAQESGGGMPRSYVPQPEKTVTANVSAPTFSVPMPPKPAPVPPSSPAPVNAPAPLMSAPKKSSKGVMVGILTAVIVVGLAALGYFVLYPMIFSEKAAPNVAPAETPNIPSPIPNPSPAPEPVPAPETQNTPQPLASHASLFKSPTDTEIDLPLASLTVADIKNAIAFDTANVLVFKEMIGKTSGGEFLSLELFTQGVLPAIFTPTVASSFEPDFSLFALTNPQGTWLGFVAKAKTGTSLPDLQKQIGEIEKSSASLNFYLESPGVSQSWKSGSANGTPTRYQPFAMPGASFNYAWKGEYLIMSASYDGFKEALRRLE